MRRAAILGVIFALIAWHDRVAIAAPAQPPAPAGAAAVAIIYDGADLPVAHGYLAAHYIKNLLGHFGLRGELIRLADYRLGQLAHYRTAFYVGTVQTTHLPTGLLKDIKSSRQPFCWLGLHIDQLLADPEAQSRLGLRYSGYAGNGTAWRVRYKDTLLPSDNFDLSLVEPVKGSQAEVRAVAVSSDNTRRTYVVRRGRFWYFADTALEVPQESSRYLVFCDLLHDILEIDHAQQSEALVRLEDVSAQAEPGDLRAAADVLSKRHIPFQIATIPLYRSPWDNVEMRLADRPQVVDAIHYMIDRGGTPVMHGWSHQYHGSTGDDYEFWDGVKNTAINGDTEPAILQRLDAGLTELFADNIFPIGFETPHYAASKTDYRAMQQRFRLFYERIMPLPNLTSVQYVPYPVIDEFGRYVIPENLGYVPLEKQDPKVLIENARYMRVVRDGLPSFYFHPFLDAKLLDQVLAGVSALGYHFVSLREYGGEVEAGRYAVRTQSGAVQLSPHDENWRMRRFDATGKLVSQQESSASGNTPMDINVDVPAGGWVALDCFHKTSSPSYFAQAGDRLGAWWKQGITHKPFRVATAAYDEPGEAWILSLATASAAEANDQQSYTSVLDIAGFSTRSVSLEQFSQAPSDKRTLVVVPQSVATRLSEGQQKEIVRYLASGGAVLADGSQRWLPRLGFRMTGWRLPVTEIEETSIEAESFSWQPEELAERYTAPSGSRPLALDTGSKQPVAITGQYGAGRYVYLSVPLDNHTPDGVSHYPYLIQYLAEGLHIRSGLHGGRIEAYFDPGYRAGVNPDNLANFWKQSGVRTVYVAAWHFYEHYSYPYSALIRACHRNGISVYAWFMFPQVTQIMWQRHPEWREQSAAGGDGRPGWRYLMNFQDPACFRASMDWAKDLLRSESWDGINIAELNFDAAYPDYLQANNFVPMNSFVRTDFARKHGFDPAQLFQSTSRYYHERNPKALAAYLSYREDIVTEWHRRVLGEVAPLVREHGLDVIVTMIDSLHSKYVQPALGVNSRRIAALTKEFDFTLQVEDPVEHWADAPSRYKDYAEVYRQLVPEERRLMFDINVVNDRDIEHTSLPSAIARGTELAETVKAAAVQGRVAIYAEHTVGAQDWPLLGIALAQPARLVKTGKNYQVHSPFPVYLDAPEGQVYSVDGHPSLIVSSSGLLIPSGDHQVSASAPWLWFSAPGATNTLMSLSGDLLATQARSTGLTIQYTSPSPATIVLGRRPQEISLDGHQTNLPVEARPGEWVLQAPRGTHLAEIRTLSTAGIAVDWWSEIWSWVIALVAGMAVILMVWLYFRVRLHSAKAWRQGPQEGV
jgi:uncharacterized protein YdaL